MCFKFSLGDNHKNPPRINNLICNLCQLILLTAKILTWIIFAIVEGYWGKM